MRALRRRLSSAAAAGIFLAAGWQLTAPASAALAATPRPAAPAPVPASLTSAVLELSRTKTARSAAMLAPRPDASPAMIIVRRGDTLSSIAHRLWHHQNRWPVLWWANRHKVPNPNLLLTGTRLRVPLDPAPSAHLTNAAYGAIPPPPPPPPPPPAAAAPAAPAAQAPAAAPAPVAQSAPAPAPAGAAPGSFQACVIARESGGNASAVNPSSGAGGLYQFLPSTWAALGHSGSPQNASVAEQNQAFAQEYAQSGTSAWAPYDGC